MFVEVCSKAIETIVGKTVFKVRLGSWLSVDVQGCLLTIMAGICAANLLVNRLMHE